MRRRTDVPDPRERYRLDPKPLGKGGFAEVFRAEDRATGAVCALKRARRVPQAAARLEREIAVLQRLRHPHVMPLLDQDPLSRWYTMPVAWRTYEDVSADDDAEVALEMLRQVGSALAYAHEQAALHRDLSPRNILDVGTPGAPCWVLADWGLVSPLPGSTDTPLTRNWMGTEPYTAPEVISDRRWTARSDLYALAKVVQRSGPWRSAASDARLRDFLTACTASDPDDRPASVGHALRLLATPGEAPQRFLVWRTKGDAARTMLVEVPPHGAVRPLGERPGLHVSDGVRLWTLLRNAQPVRIPDWRALFAPREGDPAIIESVPSCINAFFAERYDTGDLRRLTPADPRPRAELEDELDYRLEPVAGAGAVLLLKLHTYWYGGGTHGHIGSRFAAVDLRSPGELDALVDTTFADRSPLPALAREQGRIADLDDPWEGEETATATCWRPIHLHEEGNAVERIEVQYTRDCNYAASDFAWSSYTRSVRLVGDLVPPSPDLPPAPVVLRGTLAELAPAVDAYGWSEVATVPEPAWVRSFTDPVAASDVGDDVARPFRWRSQH